MDQFFFSYIDYMVFILMLCISTAIGIYFGFYTKRDNTTDEYLLGNRKMKTIPIAISLVASQLSAFTIMTLPGEMYVYGINYVFLVLAMIINVPIICYIIIPVFYNNNISNCYEYLELRFNRATRELLTIVFIATIFTILPIFNFMPSLAFAQVTNFNIHIINAITSSICIFYTMFGGIKAVVWTDVVQASIMVFSIVFVCVMGVIKVNGISEVLQIASEGNRLQPDFTFDLKTRTTFWNGLMSSICIWVTYVGMNQGCVQRIVSLPTLKQAKRSLTIFGFGFIFIVGLLCFTGITMYAYYHECDPIQAGFVEKPDKLLPYFVQNIIGHFQGIPGLFISCIFSASLSTMSACMNAVTGLVYMDYIKPRIKHTENRANIIMKSIVFLLGIYAILGGIVVEKFTSVLQLMYTITGVTFGATFGVFTLGLLVPKVHGRAALIAVLSSVLSMLIIAIGAHGNVPYKFLPSSIEGCDAQSSTFSLTKNLSYIEEEVDTGFNIFEISFNWYTVIGTLIVYIVGIVLSFILPPVKKEKINPKLLSPLIQKFVKYHLTETDESSDVNFK